MLSPAPPASSGMFSIEKPAARAFLRTASTAVKSIAPAAAISLLQREDLVGDEAADALLQLGDVGGQLGDDHGAGS